LDEIDDTLYNISTTVDPSIIETSSDPSFAINTSTQDTTDSSDSGTVSLSVTNYLDYNDETYFAEDYASTYSLTTTTF